MKSKIVIFIIIILLIHPGRSYAEVEKTSVAKQMELYSMRHVVEDVDKAIAAGDYRFAAIEEGTYIAIKKTPGVADQKLISKYGSNIILSTSGCVMTMELESKKLFLSEPAAKYAEEYNRLLLKKLMQTK